MTPSIGMSNDQLTLVIQDNYFYRNNYSIEIIIFKGLDGAPP